MLKECRVLIIEDHPVMRESLATLFERQGFAVTTAADGRIGIGMVRQQHPDLIVCDLQMPAWSGRAVLETIRAHAPTSDIPFIMLTAQNDPITRDHCLQVGASGFVGKESGVDELMRVVEEVLSGAA